MTPQNYKSGVKVQFEPGVIDKYFPFPQGSLPTMKKLSIEDIKKRYWTKHFFGLKDEQLVDFFTNPYVERGLYNAVEGALPRSHRNNLECIGNLCLAMLKLKFWHQYAMTQNQTVADRDGEMEWKLFFDFLNQYEQKKVFIGDIKIKLKGKFFPDPISVPVTWFAILYDNYCKSLKKGVGVEWEYYLTSVKQQLSKASRIGNQSKIISNRLLRQYANGFHLMLTDGYAVSGRSVCGIIAKLFIQIGVYPKGYSADNVRKLISK